MQVFVTGASGFIGGAVASSLFTAGHKVRGLVRNRAKADAVAAHAIDAVVGSLDDAALLQAEARAANAVVNAASSDDKAARVAIDRLVLEAPGIRSVVLCNAMIYGNARRRASRFPRLSAKLNRLAFARYIGRGLNRWSNVHIATLRRFMH